MSEKRKILGLIAGGGQFPLMVAEAARKSGFHVVAVAVSGETEPSLSDKVEEIVWIKLGQLGHLIKAFKKNGVQKALMAGTITKKRMFENIRPDLKGLAVMSRLAIFHDDNILRSLANELTEEGIEIVSSTTHLPELIAPPGCLTRRRPSKSEKEDIYFGWEVAKELGRLDIGQSVVVRSKTVLALEAIDGTDETILRGGRLAKKNAVVVKVSKPDQDLCFDVPSVGLETVKVMSQVKASALAVEAGKTLLFDRSEMVEYADRAGIAHLYHNCVFFL
ncbi:MAG: UDP-2,3-diacylglucosamine diphosphatase LpxI, partial [Desulfobacterales bacterium]|nr:UDP-2,3-diacylglucosamine diphosphatase LpxI [Desulfobacterales bacterium]